MTAVSRNCWFLFFRVYEKRLSLTENNPFAGFATDAKPRNVRGNAKGHFNKTIMKFTFRLFCSSIILIFLAWTAKMHFVFGGDYVFRLGTLGVLLSIVSQIIGMTKNSELKYDKLINLYIVNSICLFIAYLGMMMKVSHIMNSQFEKDFVLDFIGIPAILTSIIYNFSCIDKLIEASKTTKLLFFRQILLPWTLFLFSFLLYAIYSVILTRV